MQAAPDTLVTAALVTGLCSHLHDRMAMEPEAARWAVESLAQAVGRLPVATAPDEAPAHTPDREAARSAATHTVGGAGPSQRHDRHRPKRIILVAATALAALVAVAVVAATLPMRHEDPPAAPILDRSQLLTQNRALGALEDKAIIYDKTIAAIKTKARKNQKAVAAWEKEWRRRQARYESQKATAELYNANRPSTPSTSVPGSVTFWNSQTKSYDAIPQRKIIPGYTAPAKPLPSPPEKPPKVHVRLKKERRQLAALTQSLREVAAAAAQTPAGPQLAAVEVALADALDLLQTRVDAARGALRSAVTSKAHMGAVIDQEQIASIEVTGIVEAINAVRATLLQVLQSQGIDPNALTAPSPTPASSSASPGPSSSAAAP